MQRGNLRIVEQPPAEPVTLAQLKEHANVYIVNDDDKLTAYIVAARAWAEQFCRRRFVEQTVDYSLDSFPCGCIELPGGELREILSISYYNTDDALTVWDDAEYRIDYASEPARVEPASGYAYPATSSRVGAVIVRYRVGYAPGLGSPTDYAENIPAPIKHAIKMIAAHYYEHAESVTDGPAMTEVPFGAESMLWPYRIMWGG